MRGRLKADNLKDDDELQVRCFTGDQGHVWIKCYDKLPPKVRLRLRESTYNLCPACLVGYFLPEVRPGGSEQQRLFTAIEIMEATVRRTSRGK
jgi:hypothetical protein